MLAVQVSQLSGPSALELRHVPDPTPHEGEVIVEVHRAGVNFPDLLMSYGQYQLKPALPFIPGSEVAGVRTDTGQRVAAFSVLGGFAERVACDPATVFALPDNVSFDAGAALLMNYLTVEFALTRRAQLTPGQSVLVHGAAGGIGVATIQLAKQLGARVIACVSSDTKAQVARDAGADVVVFADDFLNPTRELGGVDVVMDPVGGTRFTDSLRTLRPEGKLLVVGFAAGDIPEVRVNRLLLNNVSVVGVGWGAFWMLQPEYLQEQWQRLLPLLETGVLTPPIGSVYPLEKANEALAEIEERRAVAKVLLCTTR
jgi:NADPH2:quinone reductase